MGDAAAAAGCLRTTAPKLAGAASGGRRASPPRSQLGARPMSAPHAPTASGRDRAAAPPAMERPAIARALGHAALDGRRGAAPARPRPAGALEPKPPVVRYERARPAS